MNLLPILYALLATLTGITVGDRVLLDVHAPVSATSVNGSELAAQSTATVTQPAIVARFTRLLDSTPVTLRILVTLPENMSHTAFDIGTFSVRRE